MMKSKNNVTIIGGGLAGSECAYQLARNGFNVTLYEMKPTKFSPAHSSSFLAEIVCSNSLKNDDVLTSSGLLKSELKEFDSLILQCAYKSKVPAGNSLSVDREKFSTLVTEIIENHPNIKVIRKELTTIPNDEIVVVATGPLTSESLLSSIKDLVGQSSLYFFDASAPIVTKESLDENEYFIQNRYSDDNGDYINCPLNKEQYETFVNELINAKRVELKDFEDSSVFEGCMPVEILARRGVDSLRFGPMKPIGLGKYTKFGKCYAVVQLRKENIDELSYNLVGFQTNLTYGEQKRVFSLIPALRNAEFIKYGVMHKNTFINSPTLLTNNYNMIKFPNIYFAGQISGVEGYIESTASGLSVALSIISLYNIDKAIDWNSKTMLGALSSYVSNIANANNFQPMNSNYGIMENLEIIEKDKELKRKLYYERSMEIIKSIKEQIKWK